MQTEILDRICGELVKAMGPVAPVVLADKLKGLGVDPEQFPVERAAELVEMLSYEIQDERTRAEFQKGALKQLKHATMHSGV
jgi:hypothetical protein